MYRGYDGAGVSYTELEVLPDFSGINTLSTGIIGGATRGPLTKTKITNAKQLRKIFGDPVESDWGLWAALKVLKNSNLIWYKRVVSSAATKGVGAISGKVCKFLFETKDFDEYLNGAKIVVTLKPGTSRNETEVGEETLQEVTRSGSVVVVDDPVTNNITKGGESGEELITGDQIAIPSGKQLDNGVSIAHGGTTYVEGTDYTVNYANGEITWLTESAPEVNTEYQATYRTKTVSTVTGDRITLGANQSVNKIKKLFADVTVGAETITYEYTEGTDFNVDYATGDITWIPRAGNPVVLPNVGSAYHVMYVLETLKTISELDRYDITVSKNGTVLEKLTNFTESEGDDCILTALADRSDYLVCRLNPAYESAEAASKYSFLYGTYTISGGNAGIEGLTDEDYVGQKGTDQGMQDFLDPEALDISTMIIPGVYSDAVIFGATEVAESRGDIMYIADMPSGLTPQQADKFSRRKGDWTPTAANKLHQIDSKFVAMYYPWVLEYVADWGKNVYTPPSAWAAAQFAYNDTVAHTWFAPAGFQSGANGRGVLTSAIGLEHNCTQAERDILYADDNGCVNPIVGFVNKGITLWGNKTTLRTSQYAVADSSWTQISVRRLCNYCRKVIIKVSMETLFQPNTETYWRQWRNKVETELQRIKDGDGIEAFKVQMDRTTISDEDLYYGRAPGKVFIKPIHAIEWIPITFTVTHDSVIFTEENAEGANA